MAQPQLLFSQFSIKCQISCGTFGQVFEGVDIQSGKRVAIKREITHKIKNSTFRNEIRLLSSLQGISGIPKLYYHGKCCSSHVIVMELLDRDIASCLRVTRRLGLKTVLTMGLQLTKILQQVHQRFIVHRDIKPENIAYGNQRFYLIDYGISKLFVKNGKLIPQRNDKNFVGTNKYAPIVSHNGLEQFPKDDLESLIYLLIYCLRGGLPWDGIGDHNLTGDMKKKVNIISLCIGCPRQFGEILQYLKSLQYDVLPNYKMIIDQFEKAAYENKITLDNTYEWTKQQQEPIKSVQTPTLDIFNELTPQSDIKLEWISDSQVNFFDSDDDDFDQILIKKYESLPILPTKFLEFNKII